MTANVEALLPGALVLLDTPGELRGSRAAVLRQVHAPMGRGVTVEVCVGPCAREQHSTDCPAVAFGPDELLLIPAGQTADAGYVTTAGVLLLCIFGSLLLLAVLALGQRGMCRLHHDQIRYCPGYTATTTTETTR